MKRFDGKSVIVTGAARGIGAATARRAAAEGAKVVVADILGESAETLAGEIVRTGGTAIGFAMNVTDPHQVAAMVDLAVRRFGRLDIAVNNAGIVLPRIAGCAELEDADWRNVMATNAGGVFLCCRAELRQFLRQGNGGVIVNVASIAGLTALAGCPSYTASKHAVVGLTRSIAQDYARQGIRCNAICPAGTDTAMLAGVDADIGRTLQHAPENGPAFGLAELRKVSAPLGRLATAEEQAGAILWLASAEAAFITGVALPVDGGWTSF
jgi:NAD(P)-dependent dehydrogenase (short-subunit alcohol dehydrogenase family)